MTKKRLITASICAVLLSAMTAFHAYIDTSTASAAELNAGTQTSISREVEGVTGATESNTESSDKDSASGTSDSASAHPICFPAVIWNRRRTSVRQKRSL